MVNVVRRSLFVDIYLTLMLQHISRSNTSKLGLLLLRSVLLKALHPPQEPYSELYLDLPQWKNSILRPVGAIIYSLFVILSPVPQRAHLAPGL
jgi:hypothetical protein